MKSRLDTEVVRLGLTESREKARALIMAGSVYVNSQKADKPGIQVSPADKIELRAAPLRYVSRGGLKLEKAMRQFKIELEGAVCMDIGASSGGFTDCMLQNGAAKVYAVDVGYGQLDWKLRNDARVVNMERTNIRYVTPGQIGEPLDFISVDVSFISLTLVLPVAKSLLSPTGRAVCLIKPQFEAGKGRVGKNGVVRDPAIHAETIQKIITFSREIGFGVQALDFSPVRGPKGNIEYLLLLSADGAGGEISEDNIAEMVRISHLETAETGA